MLQSSNIPMRASGTSADLRREPPRNMPSVPAHARQWRYDSRGWTRDLRIDFLRGFVFILLFTSHFSFFSWFALVGWERLGVISSAEMFILLSGIVTGAVYGKRLKIDGLGECTVKLFKRS
jgi:hypothetical protein